MTHPFSFAAANDPDNSPTAAKVAEVFLTAGHAFQKLGDLSLKLNQPINENTNETKWSEKDVDRLKESLARFASDLDNISDSVQGRIVQKIKTDIKRKTLISGGLADSRAPLNTPSVSAYGGTLSSGIGLRGTASGYAPSPQSVTAVVSTSLAEAPLTGAIHGGRLIDVKEEFNNTTPPVLNAQGISRSTQPQSSIGMNPLKRNVSPSGQIYGAAMAQRSYGSGVPPYKKPAFGGTTFRPIRTINATVNASPGGGHSIQLARPGGGSHPQQHQQQRQQYLAQHQPHQQQQQRHPDHQPHQAQSHQQQQMLRGVLELEDSPPPSSHGPPADKDELSRSPVAEQQQL